MAAAVAVPGHMTAIAVVAVAAHALIVAVAPHVLVVAILGGRGGSGEQAERKAGRKWDKLHVFPLPSD
jgi:UDP-N-acetyl-D-mannosaminuronic acid transferase (WecB/TagA/CpsF family)